MKNITGSAKLKQIFKYPILTIGNYDGIHNGHKKIIRRVLDIARKKDGTSILYTFEPHPVKILSPKLIPPRLQTSGQKIAMLDSLGLDILIIEPFTKTLAAFSAEKFFKKIILERIHAKEIVVGYDFTFGQRRTGKIEDLERLSAQSRIKVHVVDAVFFGESLLSSTHIRHFIEEGDLTAAEAMLGRPYSVEGIVIKGRGIGGELGFHTANLAAKNELIPPPGVYITATTIKGKKKKYKSVTNIGYNPTFGGTRLSIETYILDYKSRLINNEIEIEFYKKIRREMTFESIDDLRNQIIKDVRETRKYYEKRAPF